MSETKEQHPERVDAQEHRGQLIASEHIGRYLWGAQLVDGHRVLDAGSGTGYGTEILAAAGASQVIGVDIAVDAVEEARVSHSAPNLEYVQGDLFELDFEDDEFDRIVCFEVIEHVERPEDVLAELARVLAPGGVLCISTPNKRVYPEDNPYHLHEFEPEEFAAALGSHFGEVALYRQSAWLASSILSDTEAGGHEDGHFSPRTVVIESLSGEPREETFTIALAGDGRVPVASALLALGEPFEVRWWQEKIDGAQAEADRASRDAASSRRAADAAEQAANDAAHRLLEVEETLIGADARREAAEERGSSLEGALRTSEEEADRLARELARSRRVMDDMKDSIGWRITAPLRGAKRLVKRGR